VKENNDGVLSVGFDCEYSEKLLFCYIPKMNRQGYFIINGHGKVTVFQSVRAPSIYFFANEDDEEKKDEIYGEIIPFKGP
jgi:DNA-directed RNA polymerase beta subunit